MSVRALVTGAGGQLGRALSAAAPTGVEVTALTHAQLDIADSDAVAAFLADAAPDLLINAAAFTRVDDAEREPAAAARANGAGPAVLAAACARAGAWLVQVSTDYVFDGAQGHPYGPTAAAHPLSVYGRTKLEGERAALAALPQACTVVRASWLYSARAGFAARMLALMRTRAELSVVSDQVGTPTAASGLAAVLWSLGTRRAKGLWHWSDAGVASWYDFAMAIAGEACELGLLARSPEIRAIPSAEYPTAAARPAYSVLDKRATEQLLGMRAPHWRAALRRTLAELAPRPDTTDRGRGTSLGEHSSSSADG